MKTRINAAPAVKELRLHGYIKGYVVQIIVLNVHVDNTYTGRGEISNIF